MQQIFLKSIDGIPIQFNRLLYPLRYHIKKDVVDGDGTIYEIVKSLDGPWQSDKKMPAWLDKIFDSVCKEIILNEQN